MTSPDHVKLAECLFTAMNEGSPIEIADFPALTEDDGYEVQRLFVRSLCTGGSRRVAGFKLSMTSPETQALAAASGPAYGTLTSDIILDDGSEISMSDCFEPRVELELQFLVEEDLSAGAKRAEIERKCSVAPGIEVPDSRFRHWFGELSVGHIVSDLGLAGHVVVGASIPLGVGGNLPEVVGELRHRNDVVTGGLASMVMGDPLTALEWLTNRLDREGRSLEKGTIVSSGTLCMPVPMETGTYRAIYAGIGEVRFSVLP